MYPVPKFFKEFAEKQRFKITRDECDDPVIPGKFGHFYVHSETKELIGICLTDQRWPIATAHKKNKLCLMRPDRCHLECEVEGIWVTDVHDQKFIELARKVLKVRSTREYSDEYRKVLRNRVAEWKYSAADEPFTPPIPISGDVQPNSGMAP